MKKQFNNESININNLEQGKTGNADLDNSISNVKEEPLIFSVEEANYLVENAMTNEVTSSVIKNTIIIGGAVLLSAIFGWMYYEFNHTSVGAQTINESTKINNRGSVNERNKIKLSSSENEYSDGNSTELNPTGLNSTENNSIEVFSNSNNQTSVSNNYTIITNNSTVASNSTTTSKKNITSSDKQATKSSINDPKKTNSNFSKTIITQRYFDDGSAKMTLEYKNQPARITINSRGIESLFINSEEVDPSYYYLYEDLAIEAFRRSKIEPLAGATHDANAKPNINAMMTGALTRRGLIKEGEIFNFELTPSVAILNSISLKADVHKDLLQVYQSAFGSSLPRGGKFIIDKQP
jgi:hypothetical protein